MVGGLGHGSQVAFGVEGSPGDGCDQEQRPEEQAPVSPST